MSGKDDVIKHSSKTASTRSIKIDEESKKSETREGNWQSITEKEFGKRGSEERMEEKM